MDNLDLVETVVLFPNKTSISAIFHPLHAPVVGASRQCSANVDLWTTRTFEEVNMFDPNDTEYQANHIVFSLEQVGATAIQTTFC